VGLSVSGGFISRSEFEDLKKNSVTRKDLDANQRKTGENFSDVIQVIKKDLKITNNTIKNHNEQLLTLKNRLDDASNHNLQMPTWMKIVLPLIAVTAIGALGLAAYNCSRPVGKQNGHLPVG
jgi:ABC-type transport system involved in cytochrome bd biosynthesis fused ATPase/permease subunit